MIEKVRTKSRNEGVYNGYTTKAYAAGITW